MSFDLRSHATGLSAAVVLGCAGALGACVTADPPPLDHERQAAQQAPHIEPRRSLAITEQPILARFSLERVLDQLIAGSGVTGLTSTALFQQGWDVFNPGPGLGAGPHCDDTIDPELGPVLNGYPFTCRPAPSEGAQASCDPFAAGSACAYIPIGLFMRFDLAPEDGRHCGEYRIVYAKESGRTEGQNRNLVILEAAMRNPHVNQGLRGCRKLVQAFAELSDEPDLEARADVLEDIYFDGHREFDPVVLWSNFGDNPLDAGQIRTNQFMQPDAPRVWSLRELKLRKVCGATCTLQLVPVTAKVNPYGPLFADAAATTPFQLELADQLPSLTAGTIGGIGLRVSDVYNSGQSEAAGAVLESQFAAHFAPPGAATSTFRNELTTRLASLGSALTPDEVVARAQAMSCAGCHRFSNNAAIGGGLTWPPSLGFVHISERDVDLEVEDGVTRFKISLALTDHFLPDRASLIADYLADVPRPVRPADAPIGNRWSH
ncbi:MAG: hypothetical protein F9K40_12615 [Kofleriaceae bacterium]|nr:MAG: hypothetical protein F9K40_12615 [Kofleriaceae bacterium]MBZ0234469.1 hypothetical protein [Kofleriaceae bacterium]